MCIFYLDWVSVFVFIDIFIIYGGDFVFEVFVGFDVECEVIVCVLERLVLLLIGFLLCGMEYIVVNGIVMMKLYFVDLCGIKWFVV